MSNKAKLIQLIHVAKRELGLDDETYRAALQGVCQKESCKGMTVSELEKVLAHFEAKGFKKRAKKSKKRMSPASKKPVKASEIRVIRAIWIQASKEGLIYDGSEDALDKWVLRMSGVRHVGWLDGHAAFKVLEALKKWHKRLMISWLDKNFGYSYAALEKEAMRTSSPSPFPYAEVVKAYEAHRKALEERKNAE